MHRYLIILLFTVYLTAPIISQTKTELYFNSGIGLYLNKSTESNLIFYEFESANDSMTIYNLYNGVTDVEYKYKNRPTFQFGVNQYFNLKDLWKFSYGISLHLKTITQNGISFRFGNINKGEFVGKDTIFKQKIISNSQDSFISNGYNYDDSKIYQYLLEIPLNIHFKLNQKLELNLGLSTAFTVNQRSYGNVLESTETKMINGKTVHISNYQTKYFTSYNYNNPIFCINTGMDWSLSAHWGLKANIRYWLKDLSKPQKLDNIIYKSGETITNLLDVTGGIRYRF